MIDDAKLDEIALLADGGISQRHVCDQMYAACNPRLVADMVAEIKRSREFVAAMRCQATNTPIGGSRDYRDGYEACGNWIAHHLRVLDQSA